MEFLVRNGVLIKYTGADRELVIPDNVNEIGAGAFKNKNMLESVYISDSVERIRCEAFYGCRNLKKVRLPEYLSCVEDLAFEHTPWIDICESFDIRIPEGVDTVAKDDFAGVSHQARLYVFMQEQRERLIGKSVPARSFSDVKGPVIGNIIMPSTLKTLENDAFSGIKMSRISLNEGLERIGERAFENCEMLGDVILPDTVKELGKNAFKGCSNSELSVRCSDGVFSALDREIRSKTAVKWLQGRITCTPSQEKPLIKYIGRTRDALVKQIEGDDAEILTKILTCGKAKLEQIETYIEAANDGKHPSMLALLLDYKKKNFSHEQIEKFSDQKSGFIERTSKDWEKIFRLKQDENGYILAKYKGADLKPEIPTDIDGTPVYAIGNNAFKGNESIVEIDIPCSIQTIGDSAFEACIHLTTVRFTHGLKHIGKRTFYGCEAISGEMYLPEGLLDNGTNAFFFGNNMHFKALHLPQSMKVFKGAFGWDYDLDLYVHGKKTKYNSNDLSIRTLFVHRDSAAGKRVLEEETNAAASSWIKVIDEGANKE